MRIRFFKPRGRKERFAWLPKRMSNGTWIWLEPYRRLSRGASHYAYGEHND